MDCKIFNNKLSGQVVIPPSKSIAHRAIICACIAGEGSIVRNIALSQDMIATIDAVRSLGAVVELNNDELKVLQGIRGINKDIVVDCNESGSTLRFFVPISLVVADSKIKFVGKGKLGERPLNLYYDIFNEQGIFYDDKSSQNPNHYLDLTVQGSLQSGEYKLAGDVSSQFVTGLIFALAMLKEDSTIHITSPLQSASYVDLTLQVLKDFGIKIVNDNYKSFYIQGGQKFLIKDYYVEGDYSQSAFYEVANYLGSNVQMIGLNQDSLQGDKAIITMIDKLKNSKDNQTLYFDASDCPDIIPVFSIACALRKGKTVISNVERLKIKECDRLEVIIFLIKELGGIADYVDNQLVIDGVDSFVGGVELDSFNDHRIAMLLAIAGTVCIMPIVIKDCMCVKKSYPNFFEHFVALGGKVE